MFLGWLFTKGGRGYAWPLVQGPFVGEEQGGGVLPSSGLGPFEGRGRKGGEGEKGRGGGGRRGRGHPLVLSPVLFKVQCSMLKKSPIFGKSSPGFLKNLVSKTPPGIFENNNIDFKNYPLIFRNTPLCL